MRNLLWGWWQRIFPDRSRPDYIGPPSDAYAPSDTPASWESTDEAIESGGRLLRIIGLSVLVMTTVILQAESCNRLRKAQSILEQAERIIHNAAALRNEAVSMMENCR